MISSVRNQSDQTTNDAVPVQALTRSPLEARAWKAFNAYNEGVTCGDGPWRVFLAGYRAAVSDIEAGK